MGRWRAIPRLARRPPRFRQSDCQSDCALRSRRRGTPGRQKPMRRYKLPRFREQWLGTLYTIDDSSSAGHIRIHSIAAIAPGPGSKATMARGSAKRLEGPEILGVVVTQHVALSGGHQDPEKRRAGGIPAVFYGADFHHLLAEQDANRALAALEGGVAFDAQPLFNHEPALPGGRWRVPRSTPLRGR